MYTFFFFFLWVYCEKSIGIWLGEYLIISRVESQSEKDGIRMENCRCIQRILFTAYIFDYYYFFFISSTVFRTL